MPYGSGCWIPEFLIIMTFVTQKFKYLCHKMKYMISESKILEVLSSWNFWGEGVETGIERNLSEKIISLLSGVNKVIAVYGVRRAGKSYLLRQVAEKMSRKLGSKNVLYINFEEASFPVKMDVHFLIKVYETYLKHVSPDKKPVILLDEVQEVLGWERFVRTLNEKNEARVVISGSSSKLMAGEISDILSGRTIDIEVFPLGFEEFLIFKNFRDSLKIRAMKNFLFEYLRFGGFPEVVLEENRTKKLEIVRNYFRTIILKDVVLRYGIRREDMLESIARFIVSNPSAYLSIRKMSKSLQVPLKTTERYLTHLASSLLYYRLRKFSTSVREQDRSPMKIYLVDTSFFTASGFRISENTGRLMENLVAVELLRRRRHIKPETEVFYFRDSQQHEVDFVIKEGLKVKELIQVSYASSFDEVEHREIRALLKAGDLLKCRELKVITWDYEDEREVSWFGRHGRIKFVPMWKWLLDLDG